MGTETPRSDEVEHPAGKLEWEPPALTLLGTVSDLVHGGAKTGPERDPDGAVFKFPG